MTQLINHVLVADDDPGIRDVIAMAMEDAGAKVTLVENGQRAVTETARQSPDLVILDIGMPDMDGFDACRAIRRTSGVPILFLTARDEEISRVLGFELGADDYVTKPFIPRELVLRVKAILMRAGGGRTANEVLRHGQLQMIPAQHSATFAGGDLALTGNEFRILTALMRARERILSREQLTEAIYGVGAQLSDRTIDSHVRNIRHKAAQLGGQDVVETVHGVGLKLGKCQG